MSQHYQNNGQKHDRQRRVDDMAAEIYTRWIASGHHNGTHAVRLRQEAQRLAETFYEDVPLPSVPLEKSGVAK